MFIDIVRPDSNEKEFIEIADRLGYNALCFAYDNAKKLEELKNYLKDLQEKTNIKLFSGTIFNSDNIKKAKNVPELTLFKSTGDDRKVFETNCIDIIFSLEEVSNRDYIHHRASGLNQVMCSLASKNNIMIGFFANTIFDNRHDTKIMGRISQNIRLCSKYKLKTVIASFAKEPMMMRGTYDLMSLYIILGMTPKQARDSFSSVLDRIREKEERD